MCIRDSSLPEHEKFCGVVGNMGYSAADTPNTIFKGQWRDATLLERYPDFSVNPIGGERALVFFTDVSYTHLLLLFFLIKIFFIKKQ